MLKNSIINLEFIQMYYLDSAIDLISKAFNYLMGKESQWLNKQEWLDKESKPGKPLKQAAGAGSPQSAQALLKANTDVTVTDKNGTTTLYLAVLNDDTQSAQALLDAGADPNIIIFQNDLLTALHLAAQRDNTELVQALLAAGADINAQDITRQTALHKVADIGSTDSVLLLAVKADVDAQDINGKTPLHLAVLKDNIHSVRALLAAGANINAQDINEQTPLESLIKYHIDYSKYYKTKTGYCYYSDSCIEQVEDKFMALLDKMLENQDQAPNQYSSLMKFLLTQDLIPKDFICTLANHMKKANIQDDIIHSHYITLKLQNLIQYAKHKEMALHNSSLTNQKEIATELENIKTLENLLNNWKQPVYSGLIKIQISLSLKWANDSLFQTTNHNKNVINDEHNMHLIGNDDTPLPVELDVD